MTSPAFSFYAKDWLAATLTWPLEARGAYMTLLAYQWDAGGIPEGFESLARLLGVSVPKAKKLWAIIGSKFEHSGTRGWRNLRLEQERVKQQERREGLRGNGMKGGRPKKPKGSPDGNQNETYRFSESPSNENQNESLTSSSSSSFSHLSPQPPVDTGGTVRPRREHREHAKVVLKSLLGYCQHDPPCPNQGACVEHIARELAAKAVASC
jgi:uncharacterized protein YdaU (DUF1376 family)